MATHNSLQDRLASHKVLVLLVSLELCFEPARARRETEMAAATVDPTRVSTPVSRARAGRGQAHSWSLLRWKSFASDMVSHARSRGLACSAERRTRASRPRWVRSRGGGRGAWALNRSSWLAWLGRSRALRTYRPTVAPCPSVRACVEVGPVGNRANPKDDFVLSARSRSASAASHRAMAADSGDGSASLHERIAAFLADSEAPHDLSVLLVLFSPSACRAR